MSLWGPGSFEPWQPATSLTHLTLLAKQCSNLSIGSKVPTAGSVRSQAHLSSACVNRAAGSDPLLKWLHPYSTATEKGHGSSSWLAACALCQPLLGYKDRDLPFCAINSLMQVLSSLWAWWCAWTFFIFLFRFFFSLDLMIPKNSWTICDHRSVFSSKNVI